MFITRATLLFVLFALALGHYYYWHVLGEILAAERNQYFVTPKGAAIPKPFRPSSEAGTS
jgi:hypothetical protein